MWQWTVTQGVAEHCRACACFWVVPAALHYRLLLRPATLQPSVSPSQGQC